MPFDKNKSITKNGKIYYWNNEKKKVIEASLKEYDVNKCPDDILSALLSLIEVDK